MKKKRSLQKEAGESFLPIITVESTLKNQFYTLEFPFLALEVT